MRCMQIIGGIAVNAIAVDDPADFPGWTLVPSDSASIGDLWDGEEFTLGAPIVPVPLTVTRRQARQALFLAGLLAGVQTAIDATPDATQRGLIQIEWDDSQVFERYRPTLIALATAMGLSSGALDALFITAAAL